MTLLPLFAQMKEKPYQDYLARTPLRKHFFKKMGRTGFSREDFDDSLEQLKSAARRMAGALRSGPWIMGAQFTLADICLIPTIDRLVDLGLAKLWEKEFPEVTEWYARVRTRPSFVQTFSPTSRLSERYKVAEWNALFSF
jgi:glutathione S-transferase